MAVIVDLGCVIEGYCSDCTRVFATGELPEQLAQAFELCLRAQLDGIAAVNPGVSSREADAASRVAIDAAGLGSLYCHGMGHGVGLDGHEAPWLQPDAPESSVLEPGNVVAVEPGLYFRGLGGVRIENLLHVTTDGHELLSSFPNELVVVE